MSSLIRHFLDASWNPTLPEDSTMATPEDNTPPHSGGSGSAAVTYTATEAEDLQSWAETDENKVLLIERQHVPGREQQAIKFAEYTNTFKDIPQQKFNTLREFYEYLQQNVTAGKDYENLPENPEEGGVTGFSESSCKRLRTEGNCYIQLLEKGYNDFPQSQTAAIALVSNTTKDNIVDVWKDALSKCGGSKKRVFKSDICAAIKRFKDNYPSVEAQLEAMKKQLAEKDKEIVEKDKESKKLKDNQKKEITKQVNAARKETVEHLQHKQELLDEFCLAYEDKELTKPIYTIGHLEDLGLPDEIPEGEEVVDPNAERLAVYIKCFTDDGSTTTHIVCHSIDDWERSFYEYGLYFAAKKANLTKGKGKGKGKAT